MTLQEAIEHCDHICCGDDECAIEHEQLKKWLEELRLAREGGMGLLKETARLVHENHTLRELLTASVTFNHMFCQRHIGTSAQGGADNWHEDCPVYTSETNNCPYLGVRRASADALGIDNTLEGWNAHCESCWPSD